MTAVCIGASSDAPACLMARWEYLCCHGQEAMLDQTGCVPQSLASRTPSWHSKGSTALVRLVPADVARAREGAAGAAMPRAARTRLRNAGSASLAAASSSLLRTDTRVRHQPHAAEQLVHGEQGVTSVAQAPKVERCCTSSVATSCKVKTSLTLLAAHSYSSLEHHPWRTLAALRL